MAYPDVAPNVDGLFENNFGTAAYSSTLYIPTTVKQNRVMFKCGDSMHILHAWLWFETLNPEVASKFAQLVGHDIQAVSTILEAFAIKRVCSECAHREMAVKKNVDSQFENFMINSDSSKFKNTRINNLESLNRNLLDEEMKLFDKYASKNIRQHDTLNGLGRAFDKTYTRRDSNEDQIRQIAIAAVTRIRTELPLYKISRKLSRVDRAKTERQRHDYLRDVKRNMLRIFCGEDLLPHLVLESPDSIIDCMALGNWIQQVASQNCGHQKQRQLLCRGYEIAAAIRTVLCYKECKGMKHRGIRVADPERPSKHHKWLIKGFRYKFNLTI